MFFGNYRRVGSSKALCARVTHPSPVSYLLLMLPRSALLSRPVRLASQREARNDKILNIGLSVTLRYGPAAILHSLAGYAAIFAALALFSPAGSASALLQK